MIRFFTSLFASFLFVTSGYTVWVRHMRTALAPPCNCCINFFCRAFAVVDSESMTLRLIYRSLPCLESPFSISCWHARRRSSAECGKNVSCLCVNMGVVARSRWCSVCRASLPPPYVRACWGRHRRLFVVSFVEAVMSRKNEVWLDKRQLYVCLPRSCHVADCLVQCSYSEVIGALWKTGYLRSFLSFCLANAIFRTVDNLSLCSSFSSVVTRKSVLHNKAVV